MIHGVAKQSTALLTVLLVHVCVFVCQAHEGPAQVIRRLNRDIDAGRATAETYLARAIEYRILGRSSRAARDLQLAISLDPKLIPAWRESAQVLLDLGDPSSAVRAAKFALSECDSNSEQAKACHLLLAEVLYRSELPKQALKVVDHAFLAWPQQSVNAYWLWADILAAVGFENKRMQCLKQGAEATGSEVLRIAWIESCIDLGRGSEVLATIEMGLHSARLKSAWQIRRAQVMIALGRYREAQQDLHSAIAELETRINPRRPAREFVADRNLALRLLAEIEPKSG